MYSNVTPPTFPEYDATAYPHYIVQFEYATGAEDWEVLRLRYSDTPFTYNGTEITNTGEHHLQTYGIDTGEWTYWGTLTELSVIPGVKSDGGYMRVYTNHDILDSTGAVWLAADSVTPAVEKFPIKDYLKGLIMTLCSPVRSFPKREPVAFLYNGVRLPELPELPEVEYPYLFMEYYSDSVLLCCCPKAVKYNGTSLYPDEGKVLETYWLNNGVWEPQGQDFQTIKNVVPANVFWTNHDIMNDDGTVFLAASEPIPVYE